MRNRDSIALPRSARQKILIVTTTPETLATILRFQPRYLSSHFHVSLASSPGEMAAIVAEQEKVVFYNVPMKRGIAPLHDLVSIVRMIQLIARIRPDLVHSYTPKAGLVAMLASLLCRVPVRIHTFTGLIFPSRTGFSHWLLRASDALVCACATVVIPEGRGVKRELIEYKVTKKNLELIGNGNIAGVDIARFTPGLADVENEAREIRSINHIPADAFVFCYVGRLHAEKGIAELAVAFDGLHKSAHLILLGGADATSPPPQKIIDFLVNHPRVHLLGFNSDVRPALACSDVLVLPSYREGFPNVLLEGGAMQKGAIATNVNGSNEIIVHGYNGWLVDSKCSKSLHERMSQVLTLSREELAEIGINARKRVTELFRREDYLERLLAFYCRQLSLNSRGRK